MKTHRLLKAMLIVCAAIVLFSTCKKNNAQPVTIPALTTTAASLIAQTTFQIGGQITTGNANLTARGVCWSTHSGPTTGDNATHDAIGEAFFESTVTGLIANTTYYVRAYATNRYGTGYGNEVLVQTAKGLTAPILDTKPANSILPTSFISGGTVSGDGGAAITAKGVCWSISHNPTVADSLTHNGTGGESYDSQIKNLKPNTTYYVRAYATNSIGTTYGSEITVQTLKAFTLPVLVTKSATAVLQTSLTSGGTFTTDGGAAITAKGVCWGTTHNPTITGSFTSNGTGPANYVSQVKNLTANTTYYIRAYATNSVGTAYGNEIIVQTLHAIGLPTVTLSVTENGNNFARVIVKVTSDGSVPPAAPVQVHYGVCYSTAPNPTIADTRKSYTGTGTSQTDIYVDGLVVNTKYYMRAYAFNSVGTAYSAQVIATTHYAIGDRAEGGTVFWLNPTDLTHGLVVHSMGTTRLPWDNTTTGPYVSTGALSTTDGAANTLKIFNKFGAGNYAAAACKTSNEGGYTNWFLPAIDQLKLYEKQLPIIDPTVIIGGNFLDYWWSSTENSGNIGQAWQMDLGNNFAQYEDKRREWLVVAMRAF